MKYFKGIISAVICSAMVMGASVCLAETNEIKEIPSGEQTIGESSNEIKQDAAVDGSENENTGSAEENNKPSEADEKTAESDKVEISPDNPSELTIVINGTNLVFDDNDIKPYVSEGRTLVPVRQLGEALNAAVAWRASDNTVHLFRNGTTVIVKIGSPTLETCGFEIKNKFTYTTAKETKAVDENNANVTPVYKTEVINGKEITRTMLPYRAICEAFGADVDWNPDKPNLIPMTISPYTVSVDDEDAANYIENWNYMPATVLKTATVNVKVAGNFEGADPALGDGVVVTLDGKMQTAANGGACTFADVNAGTYTLTVSNFPEGYTAAEKTITVEGGKEISVSIPLEKAADGKESGENSKSDNAETPKDDAEAAAESDDKSGDTANK